MALIKVLIVEDEAIVAKDINRVVSKLNYKVSDIVCNKDDFFNSIKNNPPTIILMDIKLKGKTSGIDIVKKLYKELYIPVIYITASIDDDTMMEAIQTNPIGYIVKPFKRSELISTLLLAIYKLNLNENKELIDLGNNFSFDQENKKLYYQNNIIKLGEKETNLLALLIRYKGRTLLFDEILDEIWDNDLTIVGQNTLRMLVYRLRNKTYPQLIQSIPYQGFRIKL